MADRGDIKAGRAYVELLLKDSAFVKGLRKSSRALKDWGTGIAKIGAGIGAMGAAVTGPLSLAIKHFADAGSVLNDMAARTGVAGSVLAEFGYAAEQSGSSLEEVEGAIRKMQKFLGDGEVATDGARESLAKLGLTFEDIKGANPDEQFQMIADRISGIVDPTARAAAAMEIFGKKGTSILPMLEDLGAMRAEARDLGIAPSEESIKLADALGDAFHRVEAVISGLVYKLGAALGPSLLDVTDAVAHIVSTAGKWIQANSELVVTIAKVSAVVAGVGAAIVAAGTAIFGLGVVLGGVASGLGMVGSVLAAVLSPLGLTVAALAGGAYAWAKWTKSGQSAVQSVAGIVRQIGSVFSDVFGGITDALMGGNLALAGRIGFVGLELVFRQGVDFLLNVWDSFTANLVPSFQAGLNAIGLGSFTSTFADAIATIQKAFAIMCDGNKSSWGGLMNFMRESMAVSASKIPQMLDHATTMGHDFSDWSTAGLGKNEQAAFKWRRHVRFRKLKERDQQRQDELNAVMIPLMKDSDPAALQKQLGEIENQRIANRGWKPGQGPTAAQQRPPRAADPAIAGLRGELDGLNAAAAKAAADRRAAMNAKQLKVDASPMTAGGVEGTFSAAAAIALGGGQSSQERTAKATEKMWQELMQARRDARAAERQRAEDARRLETALGQGLNFA